MSEFLSRIAIGKSVVKEYRTRSGERTVYLSDGDEFQIQLFNPHPFTIGLEISVNGAGLGGKVVLRPGERVWLDRFLNDARKLKFETYRIGKGAAAKSAASINGLVTVSAFRESEDGDIIDISWNYGQNCPPSVNATKYNYDPWPVTCAFSNQTAFRPDTCWLNGGKGYYCTSASTIDAGCANSHSAVHVKETAAGDETGRIEKGSASSQKFDACDRDFQQTPFSTESIRILPLSQKQYGSNELPRIYCSGCGRKLKPDYKYCPHCGRKSE